MATDDHAGVEIQTMSSGPVRTNRGVKMELVAAPVTSFGKEPIEQGSPWHSPLWVDTVQRSST
jgi:hypothetical protein